ncbi:MAG: DUF4249 family protein [Emticicia sp.]|nr:DUF4249 family protein [Emticicia sp.]
MFDYTCGTSCWDIFYSSDINIFSDIFTDGQLQKNKLVAQIPLYQSNQCLVGIQQMSLSPNAFRYFKLIQDQSINTGTLADTPPAPIKSNVYNKDDAGELVLGYFSVSSVYEQKYMLTRKNATGAGLNALFLTKNNRLPQPEGSSVERLDIPLAICKKVPKSHTTQTRRMANTMKKYLYLYIALLLTGFNAHAQFYITGIVRDSLTSTPLEGASIVLDYNKSKNGTKTDANGKFTLTVSRGNHTLNVRYVGYVSSSKFIASQQSNLNIDFSSLTRLEKELEQVKLFTTKRFRPKRSAAVAGREPNQHKNLSEITFGIWRIGFIARNANAPRGNERGRSLKRRKYQRWHNRPKSDFT